MGMLNIRMIPTHTILAYLTGNSFISVYYIRAINYYSRYESVHIVNLAARRSRGLVSNMDVTMFTHILSYQNSQISSWMIVIMQGGLGIMINAVVD